MNDKKCMVSIWCMCFNHEQYLRQTLDSFLAQETDFPFEIIISDDKSSDSTAEIIRSYAGRYPEVFKPILLEENQYSKGVNLFEEYFVSKTEGKYVALCEGDDYWTDNTKLRRQVDFLENHPEYSACVHNTMLHYCDNSNEDRLLLKFGQDCDVPFKALLAGASKSFHTSSLMAKAELMHDMPDFCQLAFSYGFDDNATALWLYLNGPIGYLDRPMSVYRMFSTKTSWSSIVEGRYEKVLDFSIAQTEILKALLPHCEGELKTLTEREILEKEFELMYIQGRDREQRRPPYRDILKNKPVKYRVFNFLKSYVPGLSRVYRRMRGYM